MKPCGLMRRVTICKNARLVSSGMASVVEPAKTDNNLDAVTFDTTDAQTERPYSGLHVKLLHVRVLP